MVDQHYLEAGGVGLLVDVRGDDPVIVHWGAPLGDAVPDAALLTGAVPHSNFDEPVRLSVLPQASRGWRGRAAVRGGRSGAAFSPRFVLTDAAREGSALTLRLADPQVGLEAEVRFALDPSGLLLLDGTLVNTGADEYGLDRFDLVLPVPQQAVESLDTTGRWAREKHPQRRRIDQGTWVRSGRHGRTGHDATAVIAAGGAGFGWRSGEVWALHLGWSGNHESFLDRLPSGQTTIGAGELLEPSEIRLAPGESYRTPTAYAAYAVDGLDGVSARFHTWLRARPQHPSSPRPVVLNTWEAVYFAHDLGTLSALADTAAELGVERFVLDDGWFGHRRNDRAGLGDWWVDPAVWPDGLGPLIDHVRGLGMQFGLWVEPEMVNEDSDVIREHPDWIAGPAGRTSIDWRFQQVLDLANPDAFSYILGRIDALLDEYPIAYLKWDQNRDQLELGHEGRASAHAQTLAAYRLFDELKARHPRVEIESCSSGGARVDLGVLQRTDRVWTSDTNDALERQTIQRWTQLVVPPELVGAHVGPTTSHSTRRTHDIDFRTATALFGHFGIEWDVTTATDQEREGLRRAIALYKEWREVLHTGAVVRADSADPSVQLTGVVAQDRGRALYSFVQLTTSAFEQPLPVALPGLDPARSYRVTPAVPVPAHAMLGRAAPPWLASGVELSGTALAVLGLPMPVMNPEHAVLLRVEAIA
ncbi:alpha-galactosidase [Amnibacterium kyonggiense]|uniref:alpha-galactosidase n=1 Tax=Amnibacterium kyonggiense TaxID=595671 RepID=A0A4R7FS23_9MICO|nr:alpha-galactosidase [Amnibacterium kyonggiense]TDS80642.1 alpha-galactosidase [Amnibacterium kyonggiense]